MSWPTEVPDSSFMVCVSACYSRRSPLYSQSVTVRRISAYGLYSIHIIYMIRLMALYITSQHDHFGLEVTVMSGSHRSGSFHSLLYSENTTVCGRKRVKHPCAHQMVNSEAGVGTLKTLFALCYDITAGQSSKEWLQWREPSQINGAYPHTLKIKTHILQFYPQSKQPVVEPTAALVVFFMNSRGK